MDTEERIEIQKSINQEPLVADERAYEREPCASGFKGALSGAAVYTGIGALVGLGTATALVLADVATIPAGVPIVAGFATASFLCRKAGSNRFLCRSVFEKIGLWFKWLFLHKRKLAPATEQSYEKPEENLSPAPIITVVYPADMADFPASDTYGRDKLASAKLALLNLDPAKSVRQ